MRSAERILADAGHTEDKGLCLARLKERYTKAAMYHLAMDASCKSFLEEELTKAANWLASYEQWGPGATAKIPGFVKVALEECWLQGMILPEDRAEMMGVEITVWRRNTKIYEAIYSELMGWVFVGRRHMRRMMNAD